jgi:HD-GYP domain-containing protein (c-di-GMP phosphodiesterase class II)
MVADVVEAMMSHRPYRPALGIDAALQEIHANSGTSYNPDIVLACMDLFLNEHYRIDDTEHEFRFPLLIE